jgi:hypothetical protein
VKQLTAAAFQADIRGYVKHGETRVSHTCPVADKTKEQIESLPANRRRVSQIVHDDRGNARVEWIDAGRAGVPIERAPLSIEPTPARGVNARMSVERVRSSGFDPYARIGGAHVPEPKKTIVKRDLRKLGEWIKLKRELDERRSQDDRDIE